MRTACRAGAQEARRAAASNVRLAAAIVAGSPAGKPKRSPSTIGSTSPGAAIRLPPWRENPGRDVADDFLRDMAGNLILGWQTGSGARDEQMVQRRITMERDVGP
jgi:hypothetical protein